jgi:hypothetical protein
MTAMEIRKKEQDLESLLDVNNGIQILVKGVWQAWVNGDEYNEKQLVIPNLVHVLAVGTRYLTIKKGIRRWEVKPETCLDRWEIVFRPDTPMLRVSGLPQALQEVYSVVLEGYGHSEGVTFSDFDNSLSIPRQTISIYLKQLEELKHVKMFKVSGGRKGYFIR